MEGEQKMDASQIVQEKERCHIPNDVRVLSRMRKTMPRGRNLGPYSEVVYSMIDREQDLKPSALPDPENCWDLKETMLIDSIGLMFDSTTKAWMDVIAGLIRYEKFKNTAGPKFPTGTAINRKTGSPMHLDQTINKTIKTNNIGYYTPATLVVVPSFGVHEIVNYFRDILECDSINIVRIRDTMTPLNLLQYQNATLVIVESRVFDHSYQDELRRKLVVSLGDPTSQTDGLSIWAAFWNRMIILPRGYDNDPAYNFQRCCFMGSYKKWLIFDDSFYEFSPICGNGSICFSSIAEKLHSDWKSESQIVCSVIVQNAPVQDIVLQSSQIPLTLTDGEKQIYSRCGELETACLSSEDISVQIARLRKIQTLKDQQPNFDILGLIKEIKTITNSLKIMFSKLVAFFSKWTAVDSIPLFDPNWIGRLASDGLTIECRHIGEAYTNCMVEIYKPCTCNSSEFWGSIEPKRYNMYFTVKQVRGCSLCLSFSPCCPGMIGVMNMILGRDIEQEIIMFDEQAAIMDICRSELRILWDLCVRIRDVLVVPFDHSVIAMGWLRTLNIIFNNVANSLSDVAGVMSGRMGNTMAQYLDGFILESENIWEKLCAYPGVRSKLENHDDCAMQIDSVQKLTGREDASLIDYCDHIWTVLSNDMDFSSRPPYGSLSWYISEIYTRNNYKKLLILHSMRNHDILDDIRRGLSAIEALNDVEIFPHRERGFDPNPYCVFPEYNGRCISICSIAGHKRMGSAEQLDAIISFAPAEDVELFVQNYVGSVASHDKILPVYYLQSMEYDIASLGSKT